MVSGDGPLLDYFAENHSPMDREGLKSFLLLDSVPRAVVVGNFETFYDRLDDSSGGIIRDFAGVPGVIVAGGAVVGALVNVKSSELDLFLVCDPSVAEGRLRDIYGIVQRSLRARCGGHAKLLVTRSAAAVTFHHCLGAEAVEGPPVQVVLGLGHSVADVLRRFDVDCCCVAFDPARCKALCNRRGLRAMRYGACVVDGAVRFDRPSYARRLQKYADRGFAVAVENFPTSCDSAELWRSCYKYFERSGLLLRLGRISASRKIPGCADIRASICMHATAVENLARLVVLDALQRRTPQALSLVHVCDEDGTRSGASVYVPWPAGERGKYIVGIGCVTAGAVKSAAMLEDSGLYVPLGDIVPEIVEKACRMYADGENLPTPEAGHAGGVVCGAAGGGLTIAADPEECAAVLDHEQIVCVYDLVPCGAAFDRLRYVLDARQQPLFAEMSELFERRPAFPAALAWRIHKPRVGADLRAHSCADASDCDWEPFGGTLCSDAESATPLEGCVRKRVVTRLFVSRGCDGDASSGVSSGATTLPYGSDSSDDEASDVGTSSVTSDARSDVRTRGVLPAHTPWACIACADRGWLCDSATCLDCGIGQCRTCEKRGPRFFRLCDAHAYNMRRALMSEKSDGTPRSGRQNSEIDADVGETVAADAVGVATSTISAESRSDADESRSTIGDSSCDEGAKTPDSALPRLAMGRRGRERRASVSGSPRAKRTRRVGRGTPDVDRRVAALVSQCVRDYAADWCDPAARAPPLVRRRRNAPPRYYV